MLSTHRSCGHRPRGFIGIRSLSRICCVVTLPTALTKTRRETFGRRLRSLRGTRSRLFQDFVLPSPSRSNCTVFRVRRLPCGFPRSIILPSRLLVETPPRRDLIDTEYECRARSLGSCRGGSATRDRSCSAHPSGARGLLWSRGGGASGGSHREQGCGR